MPKFVIERDMQGVRKHARMADLPANRISRIRSTIDPTTSE